MIVKVKIETFWFSTYSIEMHSLTSSSFIICLWGETFGSRTILFIKMTESDISLHAASSKYFMCAKK